MEEMSINDLASPAEQKQWLKLIRKGDTQELARHVVNKATIQMDTQAAAKQALKEKAQREYGLVDATYAMECQSIVAEQDSVIKRLQRDNADLDDRLTIANQERAKAEGVKAYQAEIIRNQCVLVEAWKLRFLTAALLGCPVCFYLGVVVARWFNA